MEFTYIKKNIKGYYITFPNKLDEKLYSNIGTTYDDFENYKWVLLNEEQLQFKSEHGDATVKEVFNMEMEPEPERTLEQAKIEKLTELQIFHATISKEMSFNGHDVWADKYNRSIMKSDAESAKANNIALFKFNQEVEMTPDEAIVLMNMMAEREYECDKVYKEKEQEINALEEIQSVDSYNVSENYPKKAEVNTSNLQNKKSEEEKYSVEKQISKFMTMQINTFDLTDEQALEVKMLYPLWESFIGGSLKKNYKVIYDNKLYKVIQEVPTVLENQYPSINTAALYTEINETNKGTYDDPIPYNNNMALEEGKYYSQGGVIYKCTRSTGIAVYHPLSALVGLYVEVADAEA